MDITMLMLGVAYPALARAFITGKDRPREQQEREMSFCKFGSFSIFARNKERTRTSQRDVNIYLSKKVF